MLLLLMYDKGYDRRRGMQHGHPGPWIARATCCGLAYTGVGALRERKLNELMSRVHNP
jgi:hypothetical protein